MVPSSSTTPLQPSSHNGYRCLDLSTRCIIISCHVVFDEFVLPFATTYPPPAASLDFLVEDDSPCITAAPTRVVVKQPRPSSPTTAAPTRAVVEHPRPSPPTVVAPSDLDVERSRQHPDRRPGRSPPYAPARGCVRSADQSG